MAHGTPDWGLVGPKATTYGLDDLGEHAVRLGSPHLWDRRGDIIWLDDFRDGMMMADEDSDGLGRGASLFAANAFHGAFSVLLTAGSTLEHRCGIAYRHGLPVSSRLGLEFAFALETETGFVQWTFHWHTGATILRAVVSYNDVLNRLSYYNALGGWTEFAAGIVLDIKARQWHTGKIVADYATAQYVRFVLDDVWYNLGGIAINAGGVSTNPHLVATVNNVGIADTNSQIYVDNVVITQNEP